jgi:Zn-dependent membrane protease YugP
MGMNIGIDYLVGSLPVIGDVADAWWKSNHMNLELLKKRATVSVEEARSGRMSDWLFVGGIILGLVALGVGSAIVSLYLLFRLGQLLAGR